MDFTKVLEQLHTELANLEAAILSLEKLHDQGRPRRGRPPKLAGENRTGHPSNPKPAEDADRSG